MVNQLEREISKIAKNDPPLYQELKCKRSVCYR